LIVPHDIILICGSAWIICVLGGVIPAWRAEGYPQEVLEKVLYRNAEAYFATAASTEKVADVMTRSDRLRAD